MTTMMLHRCRRLSTRILTPSLQTTAQRCLSSSSSSSSVLGISRDELLDIREQLRQYGSPQHENTVTLQDAATLSNCPSDSSSDLPFQALNHGVASIMTLSNVKARNALSGKMMAEMADCVDAIQANHENLTAVIVRGADGFWCAGADIAVAKEHLMSREGGRLMSALMTDTLTRLYQLPVVTLAAVEGMAIGGGAELLTAMDYRIVNPDVTIRFVHAHMGVCPGWGGATRLTKLIGRQRALQLLGTAQPLNASQALDFGLIDQVVSAESTMQETLVQFLDRYVHAHPGVLHAAKRVVAGADAAESFTAAVQNEHVVFCNMWGGEANQAAMKKAATSKSSKTKKEKGDP